MGLPIRISESSKEFYNLIENLEPGTKVLNQFIIPTNLMGDIMPQSIDLIYHLLKKDVQLFFVGVGLADGILNLIDSQVWSQFDPIDFGKEYGVDWVNLGYIAGQQASWVAFAADIRSTVQYDREGNSIDSLPIMQNVNSMDDFDIIIQYGESIAQGVSYWGDPYQKPLFIVTLTGHVPTWCIPFKNSGQIIAYLGGVGSGAEYEQLINRPGKAIVSLDALSVSHIFFIFLLFIGNLSYLWIRMKGEKI